MKKKAEDALWLIDGSHYLFRSYFAISGLAAPDGLPTNAVFGFVRMILYLMEQHGMNHALITWDRPEPSWRKQAFAAYKAHREEMPQDLAEQIPYVKEFMKLMGFAQYEQAGYEADDIMYTAQEVFRDQYPQIILVTNDKDLYQLVQSPKVIGFHPALKVVVDEKFIEKKYGVRPDQMRDYLTLLGDSSDGIPGVPGVGAKTAAALLATHGDLKTLLKKIGELKLRAPSRAYLEEHEDQVWASHKLIGLTTVPKIFAEKRSFEIPRSWDKALFDQCDRLGFTAIANELKRLSGVMDIAVMPISGSSVSESSVSSPAQHGNMSLVYDLKRLLHQSPAKVAEIEKVHDVLLLEYLSDPAGFKYQEDIFKTQAPLQWRPEYDGLSQKPIYKNLELPLVPVLFAMEQRGVFLDARQVTVLKTQWTKQLEKMAKEIFKLAGTEFNISSPKQLGEILYTKCGLPVLKKKKTGPSTDASVLEALKHRHPIVPPILDYRELAKLLNTYTDALLAHVDQKSILHTELLQYGTASGRLSSRNPNLQNIPMRGDYAQPLRACFRPRKGFDFLSADYRQIELRILAHLCGCEALKQTFLRGEDIHTATAQEIFGKGAGNDPKTRTFAKAINFGILYGQTPYGLSKMLGIEMHEAKTYIEQYYSRYPEVREFQQQVIQKLTTDGVVETFYGRIRKFSPEALSQKSRQYPHTLRAAFNTVLQGAAADLIKLAMLKTHHTAQKFGGYQVMQIHDELIFEIPPEACQEAQKQIKKDMTEVVNWEVPIDVAIKQGEF